MGYTHYWGQKRSFTDNEWNAIMRCAEVIFAAEARGKVVLCSWDGTGKPEITQEYISFNGDETTGDDHETFRLDKNQPEKDSWVTAETYKKEGAFIFCKTARKPYDSAVVRMLAMIKVVAPSAVDISSDGDAGVFRVAFSKKLKDILKKFKDGNVIPPLDTPTASTLDEFTARFSMLDL